MVDNLGLILGPDARQELAFGFGDAQLVEGVLDLGRDVVPGLSLAVGRLHVVVNVVEVELRQIAAPYRRGLRPEDLERLQADVPHPERLVLHFRDLADDLSRQSLAALERVVLFRVVKPVLVVVLDSRNLEIQIGRHLCLSLLCEVESDTARRAWKSPALECSQPVARSGFCCCAASISASSLAASGYFSRTQL